MTPAPELKNHPGNFILPEYDPKRTKGRKNGVLSHIMLSMASDERIREATPSLRSLYEFLERPLP